MRPRARRLVPGIQREGGVRLRVLVTGVTGQLGHDVAELLPLRGHEALAPRHDELDVTDGDSVERYFRVNRPEAVIHCAAYTAVDRAEDEPDLCRRVNVDGTMNVTEQCRALGIPIVYISTDYVFDGTGDRPWRVDDPVSPVNTYGRSKADGETVVRTWHRHFIVRVSWVFGVNGRNFVRTMLNLSKRTDTVRVVADQYGSPTYTRDLAPLLCGMIGTDRYGTYHACNAGVCTWYDVAVETFRAAGLEMDVVPIPTSEYPMRARRPLNSRLDTSSLTDGGFDPLPPWREAVDSYVRHII